MEPIQSWTASVLAAGSILASQGASAPEAPLRIPQFQDFTLARAQPLPAGSVPADTVTLVCSPEEWREVMRDIQPPDWPNDPLMLLVGPLNHEFSCANIELRPKSDSNTVTLRRPSTAAPSALGGCAISVQRPIRGEATVLTANWYWDHQLATIRSCGERVHIPHTDNADFLRVKLAACDADSSKPMDLTDAKVTIAGRPLHYAFSALTGRDGVAILQDVPAWAGYEVTVQPRGCGEFHFSKLVARAGRNSSVELDLGILASLEVHVHHDRSGRRVPLAEATVSGRVTDEHLNYVGAETDKNGVAVLTCLPATSPVDVHVAYPDHLGADACGIPVGPGGHSRIEVLSSVNPDPRKRPIPPPCGRTDSQ